MKNKIGYRVIRTPLETYKGYPVFIVSCFEKKSPFSKVHSDRYGIAVKGGDIEKKADRYLLSVCSLSDAKAIIDGIDDGSRIELTEKEYDNWVSKPNLKNNFSFTHAELVRLLREYKRVEEKRKKAFLLRLEDANFHTEMRALESGDENLFLETISWLEK